MNTLTVTKKTTVTLLFTKRISSMKQHILKSNHSLFLVQSQVLFLIHIITSRLEIPTNVLWVSRLLAPLHIISSTVSIHFCILWYIPNNRWSSLARLSSSTTINFPLVKTQLSQLCHTLVTILKMPSLSTRVLWIAVSAGAK